MKSFLVCAALIALAVPPAAAQVKASQANAATTSSLQAQVDSLRLENAKLQGALEATKEQLEACQAAKAVVPKAPARAELCKEAALKAVTAYESGSRTEFHRNYIEADSALSAVPEQDPSRAALVAALEPLADAVAILHAFEVGKGGFAVAVPKEVYDRCATRYPDFKKRVKQMTAEIDGSYVARGVKEGADWLVPQAKARLSALALSTQ